MNIPSAAYGTAQDTLTGSLLLQPTGSVTATLGGSLISSTIDANGGFSIPINTASLAPGVYLVNVNYGGDGVSSAASTTLTLTVGAAPAQLNGLTAPSVIAGAASTSLGGVISGGSTGLVPTGVVMITLNGVTQLAAIAPDGSFSSSFAIAELEAGSYAVNYSYVGDTHFDAVTGSTSATVQYDTTATTSAAKVSHKCPRSVVFAVKVSGANGEDLESSKLQVTPTGYAPIGSPQAITPVVGSAKAGPHFRRVGKKYVLSMKLPRTMARGRYLLYYTVGSDSTVRSIQFEA